MPAEEQCNADAQQVARQRRRRIEIADVPFVAVEDTVDGERTAVQEHHPDHESAERLGQLLAVQHAANAHRQHIPEQRVARHDGPFGGTHMQDI